MRPWKKCLFWIHLLCWILLGALSKDSLILKVWRRSNFWSPKNTKKCKSASLFNLSKRNTKGLSTTWHNSGEYIMFYLNSISHLLICWFAGLQRTSLRMKIMERQTKSHLWCKDLLINLLRSNILLLRCSHLKTKSKSKKKRSNNSKCNFKNKTQFMEITQMYPITLKFNILKIR